MKKLIPLMATIGFILAACSSTSSEIVEQRSDTTKLPYPKRILVYDFAVSPAEVSPDSAAQGELSGATDDPQETPEREQLEHQIAGIVAEKIVAELHELGLPAERWSGPAPAMQDGYTLEGQFLTIDKGNAAERMIIGFGVGGSEVQALVQAYHLEGSKKSLLGEAKVTAESSKKPGIAAMLPVGAVLSGVAVAAAVSTGVGVVTEMNSDVQSGAENTAEEIVRLLKPRMEAQGWL